MLQTRIAQALHEAGSDAEGQPWDRKPEAERLFWRRLADAALGALRHDVSVSWALYNAAEQSYRMTLTINDGVFNLAAAAERMAPYHQEGDGFEVVEQHYESWSTGAYKVRQFGSRGTDRG